MLRSSSVVITYSANCAYQLEALTMKTRECVKSHLFNADESVVLANLDIATISQLFGNKLLKIRLRDIVDHL